MSFELPAQRNQETPPKEEGKEDFIESQVEAFDDFEMLEMFSIEDAIEKQIMNDEEDVDVPHYGTREKSVGVSGWLEKHPKAMRTVQIIALSTALSGAGSFVTKDAQAGTVGQMLTQEVGRGVSGYAHEAVSGGMEVSRVKDQMDEHYEERVVRINHQYQEQKQDLQDAFQKGDVDIDTFSDNLAKLSIWRQSQLRNAKERSEKRENEVEERHKVRKHQAISDISGRVMNRVGQRVEGHVNRSIRDIFGGILGH